MKKLIRQLIIALLLTAPLATIPFADGPELPPLQCKPVDPTCKPIPPAK